MVTVANPVQTHKTDVLKTDVLVVGGGLTGMSLAHALVRAGLGVCLLDRAAPADLASPAHDGRTTAVSLASRRILEGLGLWNGIARHACPIDEIRVTDGATPFFLHFDRREVGDEPMGHIVENCYLRAALQARAASLPGLVQYAPVVIRAIRRTATGVRASLADGREIAAALLAACDGRGSRLRREARIAVSRLAYGQAAIACTVVHARPHGNIAHERFLAGGPFAILPLTDDAAGRHRSSIVWSDREARVAAVMGMDDNRFRLELAARFGDFLGPLRLAGPRRAWPLSLELATACRATRLVLVGDAAHAIHPVAGQGLNLAWRDIAALAEVLAAARRLGLDIGGGTTLARYEAWRRVDNTGMALANDLLTRLFSNDWPLLRLARGIGLAAVGQVPPLKRYLIRHAMGIQGDTPKLVRGEPL